MPAGNLRLVAVLSITACTASTDPPPIDPPGPPSAWTQVPSGTADFHGVAVSGDAVWLAHPGGVWRVVDGEIVDRHDGLVASRLHADGRGGAYVADRNVLLHLDGGAREEIGELVNCAGSELTGHRLLPIHGVGDTVYAGCHYYTGFARWGEGAAFEAADSLVSITDLWVVDEATVVVATGFQGVLRYDGFALGGDAVDDWATLLPPTDLELSAIWADAGGNVVAAGGSTVLVSRAGGSFEPTPLSAAVHDLWGTRFDDLLAIGAGGAIWHFDGSTWTALDSPTPFDLWQITADSRGRVWIAGNYATLLRGDP